MRTEKIAGNVVNALLLISVLFLFLPSRSMAQKKIEIMGGSLKFDKKLGKGAKRLIGDVQFKQDNVLMFCDSAYLYNDNSLDAFGHVRIRQGDSLDLTGEFLQYNGNTRKAVVTRNVVLRKGDMQLTTDALNYDASTSVGYYVSKARIISKDNILTSDQGYFFSRTNDLSFKKNVVLTNPQFVINSDTMRYNTVSKVTYFHGPTTIRSKENLIYCEDGWYDTFRDQSRFSRNSYILTQQQKMVGDSLYYDRKKGIGRAVNNVRITDTVQNVDITGDLAMHYELKDLSIVRGHALLTQTYEKDTLFLHADTLEAQGTTVEIERKTTAADSLPTARISRKLFAYHHVKFYKSDLQGKCDSLLYVIDDSVMKLFGKPTLWSDANQLTADTVNLFTGAHSLKYIELKGSSFIASQEDTLRYNQIRGKYMKGLFRDNKLYQVNVEGNGQTIYYAKDKGELKAVNRADCSDLHIYIHDNAIDRITFLTKPEATLYPLDKIAPKELRLKDFSWRVKERPTRYSDIFKW